MLFSIFLVLHKTLSPGKQSTNLELNENDATNGFSGAQLFPRCFPDLNYNFLADFSPEVNKKFNKWWYLPTFSECLEQMFHFMTDKAFWKSHRRFPNCFDRKQTQEKSFIWALKMLYCYQQRIEHLFRHKEYIFNS